MNGGELATRGTVWLALLCYAATVITFRRCAGERATARVIWVAGCLLFLAHVASAFHFYHHWSHQIAAEDTRQQTIERIGFNFSGGIYFNYLFAAFWLIDCLGLVVDGRLLQERFRKWHVLLHAYFLFMVFNASVVFGHGLAKPAGGILCAVILSVLLWPKRFPA